MEDTIVCASACRTPLFAYCVAPGELYNKNFINKMSEDEVLKGWRCVVFADPALTVPCVVFIGRFASSELATLALNTELAAVQVLLYPGQMVAVVDADVPLAHGQQFQMIRSDSMLRPASGAGRSLSSELPVVGAIS